MPYIDRDNQDRVVALYDLPQRDDQEFLADAALAKPNVKTCTKLQLIDELESRGMEDSFFNVVDGDASVSRRWQAAQELNINHPLVASIAAILGYGPSELQSLFNDSAER